MTLLRARVDAVAAALRAWLPSASGRRIVAGMATMPSRVETFPAAFQSVIRQVDRLHLYLDGHDEVPEPARGDPRVVPVFSRDDPNLGGAGKFLGALRETEPCLYVCVDDDILYPPEFVALLVRELEAQSRRAVVGVYGIKLRRQMRNYLTDRDVLYFRRALPQRQVVDALGTGTLMFDTGVFGFDARHWSQRGLADMQAAIEAAKAGLPMICIARRRDFLCPLQEDQADSLYAAILEDDSRITLLALELQAILASRERSTDSTGIGIFATHGIVDGFDASRFEHCNLINTAK